MRISESVATARSTPGEWRIHCCAGRSMGCRRRTRVVRRTRSKLSGSSVLGVCEGAGWTTTLGTGARPPLA
eukprot:7387921-Prymnesium_polylepis.3